MSIRIQDQRQAQRKLQIITRQLYGKQDQLKLINNRPSGVEASRSDSISNATFSFTPDAAPRNHPFHQPAPVRSDRTPPLAGTADTVYLQKDLKKIVLLASSAIAVQLLLFTALSRGVVKF